MLLLCTRGATFSANGNMKDDVFPIHKRGLFGVIFHHFWETKFRTSYWTETWVYSLHSPRGKSLPELGVICQKSGNFRLLF